MNLLFVYATEPTGRVTAAGAKQLEPLQDSWHPTVLLVTMVFIYSHNKKKTLSLMSLLDETIKLLMLFNLITDYTSSYSPSLTPWHHRAKFSSWPFPCHMPPFRSAQDTTMSHLREGLVRRHVYIDSRKRMGSDLQESTLFFNITEIRMMSG